MKAVGIISEFNPFHSGHAYLIEQAKKITGADFAVIIMNGDFVQRGEPAIFNKYTPPPTNKHKRPPLISVKVVDTDKKSFICSS